MNPTARRSGALRALLLGTIALFSAATASAQLQVSMQLEKNHFIAYEPIRAAVTVANRSGHDIVLNGPGGRNWLSFDVYEKDQLLSPRAGDIGPADAFVLGAGKSITRNVNLAGKYPFARYGDYTLNASVYFPPLRRYLVSNKQRITISDSRAFWRQSVGVTGGRDELSSFRQFSLHEFRDQVQSRLYVRIKDTEGPRVYATRSLGGYLNARKPQATVDSQNRLHVLHMTLPRIYAHTSITTDGAVLGRRYYQEVPGSRPKLMIDPGGVVQVVGGVEHDPERRERLAPEAVRQRMASERPPGLPGR